MTVAELLAELKDCDQAFEVVLAHGTILVPVEQVEPQVARLDGEEAFVYILGTEHVAPVATDEMDQWLAAKGHHA